MTTTRRVYLPQLPPGGTGALATLDEHRGTLFYSTQRGHWFLQIPSPRREGETDLLSLQWVSYIDLIIEDE